METEVPDFDQLFLAYHSHVYRTLYRLTGDVQESEDLLQEVFLRFHDALPELDESKHKAWLTQVAVNTGLNMLRSRKRREARHTVVAQANPTGAAPSSGSPELSLSVRQILREDLGPKQSKLLMYYASGLSYSEIAEQMDIQPTSTSRLLLRAKRAFVKAYNRERGS